MSRKLRVDNEELRMAAGNLDMYAADLHETHAVAHAIMASAVAGFGAGSSAAALTARIAQWERETAEHHDELVGHGEGHRFASASYVSTDAESSELIGAAGTANPANL